MSFYIASYKSQGELNKAHPDARNWQCIYHKPRGMNDATAIRVNVLRALEQRHIPQQPVYQIGDFFWIPATAARPAEPACRCLQYIGDNGPCPTHGNPVTG